MKAKERKRARQLRQQGWSVGNIARRIGCAKSSVSKWVRDIPLTSAQVRRLVSNQERGRAQAANHPNSPKQFWAGIRQRVAEAAAKDIPVECPSRVSLKLIGVALYWAEGSKLARNVVSFSNSDPAMIALMMRFFRDVCSVPAGRLRGVVHIHPHLNAARAERFWSSVSGIPVKQFHKTQFGVSKASQQKRDTLPLGTFGIVVSDTRLQTTIKGWIAGMQHWVARGANSSVGQSTRLTSERSQVRALFRPRSQEGYLAAVGESV